MYWCVGEIEREIERENEMVFWITTTNNIDELILFRVYSFFCQQSTHSFGWFEPNLIECICSYTARESTITEKNWGRKRLKWSDRGGGGWRKKQLAVEKRMANPHESCSQHTAQHNYVWFFIQCPSKKKIFFCVCVLSTVQHYGRLYVVASGFIGDSCMCISKQWLRVEWFCNEN